MRLPLMRHARHDAGTSIHRMHTMTRSSTDRTVLVLGANGRLGRAAVEAFAAAGWQVLAQARQAPKTPLPAGVRALRADALDVDTVAQAAQGIAVIVHALSPDYARWDQQLPPLTAAVLGLATRTGATLMLPGNVYNFGRALPPVLDESTPFVADNPKAAHRIRLEADMQASTVRSIVIRAGDYLGGSGTWFDQAIAKGIAKDRLSHLGDDDLVHAWAYVPDLALVFVRVAERRAELAPHTVLHYAGLTLTGAELHAAIETAAGRPLQRTLFPWWLLRLASPFAPMLRALLQMRYLWQRPHRLDETRLRTLIGPVPRTPVVEVMRSCLATLPGQNLSSSRKVVVV